MFRLLLLRPHARACPNGPNGASGKAERELAERRCAVRTVPAKVGSEQQERSGGVRFARAALLRPVEHAEEHLRSVPRITFRMKTSTDPLPDDAPRTPSATSSTLQGLSDTPDLLLPLYPSLENGRMLPW